MHFMRCRVTINRLFIYLRQNSHIHRRPSGTRLYSSGNGAWNQVLISKTPNRIMDIGKALPVRAASALVETVSTPDAWFEFGGRAFTTPPNQFTAARLLRSNRSISSLSGSFILVSASSPCNRPLKGASSAHEVVCVAFSFSPALDRFIRMIFLWGAADSVLRFGKDARDWGACEADTCFSADLHRGQNHVPCGSLLRAGRKQ